jgi:hypothetical protein
MNLRVMVRILVGINGVLILLLATAVVFVVSQSQSTGGANKTSSTNVRTNNAIAVDSGQPGFPQEVPTLQGGIAPLSTAERALLPDGQIPNAVATREAALSATLPPTATPVPPTRTAMPRGWEQLGELAGAPAGETGEELRRRQAALDSFLDQLPGTVIARGGGTQPVCYDGPSSFRVEEVLLPGMINFDVGYKFLADRYWRFVVEGGPFPQFESGAGVGLRVNSTTLIQMPLTNPDRTELHWLSLGSGLAPWYEGSTFSLQYNDNTQVDLPGTLHYVEGRPERAIMAPTSLPTLGPSAYQTMTARQGFPQPTVDQAAQDRADRAAKQQELFTTRPGNVIARNQYPAPSCSGGPGGYKIEEVTLPSTTTFDIKGAQISADKFWRITIDNMIQPIGNMVQPARSVRISTSVFPEVWSGGPLTAIAFDISDLHEGDTITIEGYGRYELPEKLHFLSNSATVARPSPGPTEQACVKRAEMYTFLYTTRGKVIGQGQNSLPTCILKLLIYRVEEVDLSGPTAFALDEGAITVSKFWRVVVTRNAFGFDGVVSIDGTALPAKKASDNPNEMIALVFDRSLLREGAKVSVSFTYGDGGETLPDTLHLETSP